MLIFGLAKKDPALVFNKNLSCILRLTADFFQ
jgi:hypothetical protein